MTPRFKEYLYASKKFWFSENRPYEVCPHVRASPYVSEENLVLDIPL